MKFIIEYRRWFVGAFVVLALCLVVWIIGPLVAVAGSTPLEGVAARAVVVSVLVLGWLGIEGFRFWRERRRNRAMLEALARDNEDARISRAESVELSRRFQEAVATLSRRKFGRGGGAQMLYRLPWYMFIGPPGSGKTTALKNSGLRFPLATTGGEGYEIAGVGGTRNCDWLFTEDAVLIDTAGRYVTQDSNAQVDQAAWRTFLELLRKHRPRQPINGIIVSLSVQDLLESDDAGRVKLAQQVRTRVEELQHELGLQFPVYVVVTKCDLISGFSEFFASFDAEQRARVWGSTFAFDLAKRQPAPPKASFDAEFPLLVERLNRMLATRLADERDVDRRAAFYPFPQQFASLGPLIGAWLESAFGDTRYAQPVIVRGLYFTSGTQFGSPIDRVMAGIAQSLDLRGGTMRAAGNAAAGKSYFIHDLFTRVIFHEAGLAGHSEARELRLRRLSMALAIGSAALGALLLAGWTYSYFENRGGLVAANQATVIAAKELQGVGAPGLGDLPVLLDALDAMRKIPLAVHNPVDNSPILMGLGLYQGKAVEERVSERYRTILQQSLMPRVALHLESVMKAPQSTPEQVYAALKTYLMMYDGRRLNRPWFVGAVTDLWRSAYDPVTAARAGEHLKALADTGDLLVARFHPQSEPLVESARARVSTASLVDRAFATLRLSGSAAPGLRLSEVVGPAGVAVLERRSAPLTEPILATFTAEGYRKDVKPHIEQVAQLLADEETWVLGGRASGVGKDDTRALAAEIQRRYFDEFRAVWRATLDDVRIRKVDGLRSAQNVAQMLSQSDSPLKKLVVAVAEATRVSGSAGTAKAVEEATKSKLKESAAAATAGIFGSQSGAVVAAAIPADASRALERQLEDQFSDVRRLAGDGKAGEIDAALALIGEIASEMVAIQQRLSSGQGIREMPAALIKASSQADRFPNPVGNVIRDLVAVAGGEASGGIKKEMQAGVGGAASVCRRAIPGRYPFERNGVQDVGVQDFVDVFKAGGDLDAFFSTNLASLVDKSGSSWRLKGSGEGAPPISAASLRQFQNADAIRRAFLGGGATAQVVADLAVVTADAEVTLEYDGAVHKLKPGASVRLNWPARPNARMMIGATTVTNVEGAWALFKLVEKGQLDASSAGDRLKLNYTAQAGAGRASIEIRTGSAEFNPFRLRELQGFACPKE